MFSEKDVKDYISIKNQVRENGSVLITTMVACFIFAALDKEVLGIPQSSIVVIGVLIGLQAVSYFTSKFGSGRACELLDKAISSDPEAIRILGKLKRDKER